MAKSSIVTNPQFDVSFGAGFSGTPIGSISEWATRQKCGSNYLI